MDDVNSIYNGLLYREVLRAENLYAAASAQGLNGLELIRYIYKCGVIDGRKREHKRTNAAHKKLHEFKQLVATKCPEIVNQPTPGVVKEETSNE